MSKVSEHARGNALDLMRFDLKNKHRITVEEMPNGTSSAALSGLRTSACGYFTTVLGPGSNAAHKNHLHFDLTSTANPASTGSASDPSLRVLRVDVAIVQRGIERIDEHTCRRHRSAPSDR